VCIDARYRHGTRDEERSVDTYSSRIFARAGGLVAMLTNPRCDVSGWQRRDLRRVGDVGSASSLAVDAHDQASIHEPWEFYGVARVGSAGRLSLGWIRPWWPGQIPERWTAVKSDGGLRLVPLGRTSRTRNVVATRWDVRGEVRHPYIHLRGLGPATAELPSLSAHQPFWVSRRANGALLWIAEFDPVGDRVVTP
jgi:hypothetical protein